MDFSFKISEFFSPVLRVIDRFVETDRTASKVKTKVTKKEKEGTLVLHSFSDYEAAKNLVNSINDYVDLIFKERLLSFSPATAKEVLIRVEELNPLLEKYDKILKGMEPSSTNEFHLHMAFRRSLNIVLDIQETLQMIAQRGEINENSEGYLNMVDEFLEIGRKTPIEGAGTSIEELLAD